MKDDILTLTSGMDVPVVQFESNKDFQRNSEAHEGDSGFLRYQRKPRLQPKAETQINREVLTTLLATQSDNSEECVDKLMAEEISYRDLASLTHIDLELMGFKHHQQRDELLTFFAQLPNQDPTYDYICKLKEAQSYNSKIMSRASSHLETMRSALAAANYKLKIMPPDDVIVGEKSFASRFVLEALTELQGVASEIDKELKQLEALTTKESTDSKMCNKLMSEKGQGPGIRTWLRITPLASIGVVIAVYLWKLRK